MYFMAATEVRFTGTEMVYRGVILLYLKNGIGSLIFHVEIQIV